MGLVFCSVELRDPIKWMMGRLVLMRKTDIKQACNIGWE